MADSQPCADIGKHCNSLVKHSSCADCGRLASHQYNKSPTKCDCGPQIPILPSLSLPPLPPCTPYDLKETIGHDDNKIDEPSPPTNKPESDPIVKKEKEKVKDDDGKQTFWQWLFSLLGFGKKVKKDTAYGENYQLRAEETGDAPVKVQQNALDTARELCAENKKQENVKEEVKQAKEAQESPPPAKAETPEVKKQASPKQSKKKSPKRSRRSKSADVKSRKKYLGRPLEPSPSGKKERSPSVGPNNRKSSKTQSPPAQKQHSPHHSPHHSRQSSPEACPEEKRPPISKTYSSAKYLVPYDPVVNVTLPKSDFGENPCGAEGSKKSRKVDRTPTGCQPQKVSCRSMSCPPPRPICPCPAPKCSPTCPPKPSCDQSITSLMRRRCPSPAVGRQKSKCYSSPSGVSDCATIYKEAMTLKRKPKKCKGCPSPKPTKAPACSVCFPEPCPPLCPKPCCSDPCAPRCPPPCCCLDPCAPCCPPPCCPKPCPPRCPPPCPPSCSPCCPPPCPPSYSPRCSPLCPPPFKPRPDPCAPRCPPSCPCQQISQDVVSPKRKGSCHSPKKQKKSCCCQPPPKESGCCSKPVGLSKATIVPSSCCGCPITCMKPCCVPVVNTSSSRCPPKKPACPFKALTCPKQHTGCSSKNGNAGSSNIGSTFCSPDSLKSYAKSKDNDSYCKYLMSRYSVPVPDYPPPCAINMVCLPPDMDAIITPQLEIKSCSKSRGCGSETKDYTQNYTHPATSPPPEQKCCKEHVVFNKSPSRKEPLHEFTLMKRTPVECIREVGPRSPVKEYLSKLGLPNKNIRPKPCEDPVETEETPNEPQQPQLPMKDKSPKRTKAAAKKAAKAAAEESGEPENIALQNKSENKITSDKGTKPNKTKLSKTAAPAGRSPTKRMASQRSSRAIKALNKITSPIQEYGTYPWNRYSNSTSSFYRTFLCLSPRTCNVKQAVDFFICYDDRKPSPVHPTRHLPETNKKCTSPRRGLTAINGANGKDNIFSPTCIGISPPTKRSKSFVSVACNLNVPSHIIPKRPSPPPHRIWSPAYVTTSQIGYSFKTPQKQSSSKGSTKSPPLPSPSKKSPVQKASLSMSPNKSMSPCSAQQSRSKSPTKTGSQNRKPEWSATSTQYHRSPSPNQANSPRIAVGKSRRTRSESPDDKRRHQYGDRPIFIAIKSPSTRKRSGSPNRRSPSPKVKSLKRDDNGTESITPFIATKQEYGCIIDRLDITGDSEKIFQELIEEESSTPDNTMGDVIGLPCEDKCDHHSSSVDCTQCCRMPAVQRPISLPGVSAPASVSELPQSASSRYCPEGESSVDPKEYGTVGESCVDAICYQSKPCVAISLTNRFPAQSCSENIVIQKPCCSGFSSQPKPVSFSCSQVGQPNCTLLNPQQSDGNMQNNNSNGKDPVTEEDQAKGETASNEIVLSEAETTVGDSPCDNGVCTMEDKPKCDEASQESTQNVVAKDMAYVNVSGGEETRKISVDNTDGTEEKPQCETGTSEGSVVPEQAEGESAVAATTPVADTKTGMDQACHEATSNVFPASFNRPSPLQQLLNGSGVRWRQVVTGTEADMKMLHLAKAAYKGIRIENNDMLKKGDEEDGEESPKPFRNLLKSSDEDKACCGQSCELLKPEEDGNGKSILSRLKDY